MFFFNEDSTFPLLNYVLCNEWTKTTKTSLSCLLLRTREELDCSRLVEKRLRSMKQRHSVSYFLIGMLDAKLHVIIKQGQNEAL